MANPSARHDPESRTAKSPVVPPPPASPAPLLTVPDVARLLGVTPRGARLVLERGDLPGFRLRRRWYVRPADLDAALAEKVASQARDRDSAVRVLRGLPAAQESRGAGDPGDPPAELHKELP